MVLLALALMAVLLLQLSGCVFARDLPHVGVDLYHLHTSSVYETASRLHGEAWLLACLVVASLMRLWGSHLSALALHRWKLMLYDTTLGQCEVWHG